jgi:hypothetical protein
MIHERLIKRIIGITVCLRRIERLSIELIELSSQLNAQREIADDKPVTDGLSPLWPTAVACSVGRLPRAV